MTFCRKSKIEVSTSTYTGCCNLAHLYGILSFAKSFTKDEIVVTALDEEVIEHILNQFITFGIGKDRIKSSKKDETFLLTINDKKIVDRILLDLGYSGDEPNYRFIERNMQCDLCRAAFIAGCYLTGGTITEPSKSYHLEFTTHKYMFYTDFVLLLEEAGFEPKRAQRKTSTRIIYFKDSSQIEDFLTYVGAYSSAMELMNEKIYKDVVNHVNRQTNCENANIDKMLLSSERDRNDIEYIYSIAGRNYLPENLRKIADLRLENKEFSFTELGAVCDPILTKSGVSHRLHRIRIIADELREGLANG